VIKLSQFIMPEANSLRSIDDKVARETQYFADPFVAPARRAQWIERMDT
jgi:hypothetical protein